MDDRPNRLAICRNLLWAAFVVFAGQLVAAQIKADPWILFAGGDKGAITSHTTRGDLVRTYGAADVVDQDVDIGEGETAPGTILFPNDGTRKIEIIWKDADKKTAPSSLTIRGKKSLWKTVHNISLGTSLKELEQLNRQTFKLAGFEWDYSGTVTSWDGGTLAAELNSGHGHIILRLTLNSNTVPVSNEEQSQVLGDGDFSSHHPVMQKINPAAGEVVWVFPDK